MPIQVPAKTLPELYEFAVTKYVDRPFLAEKVGSDYKWITYGAFGEMTDAARAGLKTLDVKAGDRVALISNNCTGWAVSAFATFGLGGWVVPMYEAQLPEEWRFILDDSGASVCIVGSKEIANKLAAHRASLPNLKHVVVIRGDAAPNTVTLDELQQKGRTAPVPQVKPSADEIAALIYTSGTTGKPKGVMLTHANTVKNLSSALEIFPIDPAGETSLAFLPWAHCFGQTVELFMGMAAGNSIALLPDPTMLLADLQVVKPTILFSVPRVWNRVYEGLHRKMDDAGGLKKKLFYRALKVAEKREKGGGFLTNLQFKILDKLVFSKVRAALGGRLKYAASGAAALSPDVARFISRVGITVCEGYGLTETSPIVCMTVPGQGKIGAVGRTIPGVTLKIVPVEGIEQGGEIVVYGHAVMKGYYKRDDETKKSIGADGGFKTGDLGKLDSDGFLYITGRVKEQYKLENGKYVAPAPLEEKLTLSPHILQIFVHGANKPFNVALVILDPETMPKWAEKNGLAGKSIDELTKEPKVRELVAGELKRLSEEFKGYERIVEFALLSEAFSPQNGLLTQTLKAKRNAVLAKYGTLIESLYTTGAKAAAAG